MNTWTIKTKLTLLSVFLLGVLVAVGAINIVFTNKLVKSLTDVSEIQLPAVRNMTLADMMHDGLRAVAFRALMTAGSNNEAEKKEVAQEFQEMSENISKYIAEIENLDLRPETKEAISLAKPAIESYVASTKEIVNLSLSGKKASAQSQLEDFQKAFSELEQKLGTLGELIEKDAEKSQTEGHVIAAESKKISLIAIALSLVIGAFFSFVLIRNLMKVLTEISNSLAETSHQVAAAASEIAATSQQLSQTSTEQSASLAETAAALEEINATISQSSENAQRTATTSTSSQQKAEEGRTAVDEMLSSMAEISDSNMEIMRRVEDSNTKMSEITNVISEIGNKTKVINEIVFQTKLLSFNASVEAARAGEHGKGFAVVAEEVGNLAQMSGNAAKEISDMLNSSLARVESIARETKSEVEVLIQQGKSKVESGVVVAQRCSDILNEIVQNVNSVSSLAQEISVASREQADGVAEINKAISQLDQITQKNSAVGTESASSAESLSAQAVALKSAVDELVALVN